MLPVNTGGHSAYQNFVTENLRKYYPNPDLIPRATWDIIERFWHLDLSYTDKMLRNFKVDSIEKVTVAELLPELENTQFHLDEQPYDSLFKIYKKEFLDISVSMDLVHPDSLALAGDGTPVVTSHRERKKRICDCKEKGIADCNCDRYFSQPDCDIGWDSSRDCFYHGYDLYMLVDSRSDLPMFGHFSCASKHDSHGFLHSFFRMKSFLPDFKVSKLLLDSA